MNEYKLQSSGFWSIIHCLVVLLSDALCNSLQSIWQMKCWPSFAHSTMNVGGGWISTAFHSGTAAFMFSIPISHWYWLTYLSLKIQIDEWIYCFAFKRGTKGIFLYSSSRIFFFLLIFLGEYFLEVNFGIFMGHVMIMWVMRY